MILALPCRGQENASFVALSNSAVNEIGHLASYGNPAGLSWEVHNKASIAYVNRYIMQELSQHAFSYSFSKKKWGFALVLDNRGDGRLQQNQLDLAYSQRLAPTFSMGVKMRFIHLSFSDIYGDKRLAHSELGMRLQLSKKLDFSFLISNPSRQKVLISLDESWASKMLLGLKYHFSKAFFIHLEIDKTTNQGPALRIGMAYQINSALSIKAGHNTTNNSFSAGLNLNYKNLLIYIATRYQSNLGFSPALTLVYDIKKAKK